MSLTTFSIAFIVIFSGFVSISCQDTSQKSKSIPVYVRGPLKGKSIPESVQVADRNYHKLLEPINRLVKKAAATKSLTDDEILTLKEYQIREITTPLRGHQMLAIRENALHPLMSLTPTTLKPGQDALVLSIIMPILVANDTYEDADGYLKMNALIVVQSTLSNNKSLLPTVQHLKSDKRIAVHASALRAEEALRGLKPFSLQE